MTCPASASLAVGASITCNASYTVTQTDLDFGLITNTATGHAKTLGGTPVNSNAASATVNAVWKPALTLDKTATPQTYSKVGDIISYSYLLTNSGNVRLRAPFTVTDNKTTVTCPTTPNQAGSREDHHLHSQLHDHAGRPGCRIGNKPAQGHG